jgi:hypothetical protein
VDRQLDVVGPDLTADAGWFRVGRDYATRAADPPAYPELPVTSELRVSRDAETLR